MKYPGIFAALVAASLALPGHAADGDLWDFLPPLPPTSEVGINLGIDGGSVGLEWSRSVSAIDDSTTSSATLFVSHAPSRSWRVDASAGIEYADYRDDAIVFGSVGLAFLW